MTKQTVYVCEDCGMNYYANEPTFNDLEPRFQIHSHHDENHIFPEEYEMIKRLRQEFPPLQKWKDKKIVWYLCSRRHDFEQVRKIVSNHLTLLKKFGIDEKLPNLYDEYKSFESEVSNQATSAQVLICVFFKRISSLMPRWSTNMKE